MSDRTKQFDKELNSLIKTGELLLLKLRYECDEQKVRKEISSSRGSDELENFIGKLPIFKIEYQVWYSKSLALVKQVLPDRLTDFASHHEYPKMRKELNVENYCIRDYLNGLMIKKGPKITVGPSAAIPKFRQQLNIIKAAKDVLGSKLMDLTAVLQADLFDTEVESAAGLAKAGYLRAAGAICGVVIEKHLHNVCRSHSITIRKKNAGISDLIQLLKDAGVMEVPQWRFIQHLADVRNICDHAKGREPKKEEIEDLVAGTEKILKTVF